ncbi:histidine kinase [Nonomuraea sp. SYSU D8015]|uniref:histidine kinase n=1 Tax=Nonomuraea sp. SYSU D8015 TaxID=2593644 RepID=UPI001660C012
MIGQSLSAISLKVDPAPRLFAKDAAAARAEAGSLTGVARDALRDVRASPGRVRLVGHQRGRTLVLTGLSQPGNLLRVPRPGRVPHAPGWNSSAADPSGCVPCRTRSPSAWSIAPSRGPEGVRWRTL